MEMDWSIF